MKTTRTPSRLKVGPFVYRVDTTDEMDDQDGTTMTSEKSILLRKSLDDQSIRETLVHEVLHAILDLTWFRGYDDEERLVASVSPLLYQFLRDNKKVVGWLLEG